MKHLLFGASAISFLSGMGLFISSFKTTPTTTTANPYQSAQYAVEVPIPEPAQSILRWSGAALAVVGCPALFACGITLSDKKKVVRNTFNEEVRSPIRPQVSSISQSEPEGFRSIVENRSTQTPVQFASPVLEPPIRSQQSRQLDFDIKGLEPVKSDPYEAVNLLVHENSLIFHSPERGAGKTSLLTWNIGRHIEEGHYCILGDPFADKGKYKGIRVVGRGVDYKNLEEGIAWFTEVANERILNRTQGICDPFDLVHVHLALDELTGYSLEISPKVMTNFWMSSIQKIRQANMSFAVSTHGLTKDLMGGDEALRSKWETIKNGCTILHLSAQTDPSVLGGKRPKNHAILQLGQNKQRVALADYMRPPQNYDYTDLINVHCSDLLHLEEGQKQETKIEINNQSSNWDEKLKQGLEENYRQYKEGLKEQSDLLESLRKRINDKPSGLE